MISVEWVPIPAATRIKRYPSSPFIMTISVEKRFSLFVSMTGLLLLVLTACSPDNTNQSSRTRAESYLRENINEISTRAPEVGGTFQVSKIDWVDDDTAIVTYDDGHIELRSRIDLLIDSTRVIVSRFTLENDSSSAAGSALSASSRSNSSMTSSSPSSVSSTPSSVRAGAGLGEFCGGGGLIGFLL